jgi:hypothetical protein
MQLVITWESWWLICFNDSDEVDGLQQSVLPGILEKIDEMMNCSIELLTE